MAQGTIKIHYQRPMQIYKKKISMKKNPELKGFTQRILVAVIRITKECLALKSQRIFSNKLMMM